MAVKKGMDRSILWKKAGGAALVLLFLVTTAYADGGVVPGSADDPIVTKSYVDEQVANLKKELGGSAVTPPPASGNQGNGGNTEDTAKGALKVEKLVAGQKVVASEGTELIVRSGSVKVIAGENGDGIPDVTEGKDLKGGSAVPFNHLLLIPRSDGRGLHVVSAGSDGYSYIMIRGTYSVTPAK